MEKTYAFLGATENNTGYTKVTLDLRNGLPDFVNAEAPPLYRPGHIADYICNHSSVEKEVGLDAFHGEATQPHIKSTEALYDDMEAAIHRVNGKAERTQP